MHEPLQPQTRETPLILGAPFPAYEIFGVETPQLRRLLSIQFSGW